VSDEKSQEDYAMLNGKKYPIKAAGYEPSTYSHLDGCLYKNDRRMPCQCGALERSTIVFLAHVPYSEYTKAKP
jgi:hypothetical protein